MALCALFSGFSVLQASNQRSVGPSLTAAGLMIESVTLASQFASLVAVALAEHVCPLQWHLQATCQHLPAFKSILSQET